MKARMLDILTKLTVLNNEYQIKPLCSGDYTEENLHNALIWLMDRRASTQHIPDKVKPIIRKQIADYLLLLEGYDVKQKKQPSTQPDKAAREPALLDL